MGYPTSIVSWAAVAASGVVLQAEHIRATYTETEAIEAEMGVDPHGTAGSLAERLSIALDDAGNLIGRVAWANCGDSQRRRVRAGYEEFVTQTGGASFETLVAAIVFDQPFYNTPIMFFTLQRLTTSGFFPCFATWNANVTVNSADLVIQFQNGQNTIKDVPYGVHWVAVEQAADGTNLGL
jgi:hypothetical protein